MTAGLLLDDPELKALAGQGWVYVLIFRDSEGNTRIYWNGTLHKTIRVRKGLARRLLLLLRRMFGR